MGLGSVGPEQPLGYSLLHMCKRLEQPNRLLFAGWIFYFQIINIFERSVLCLVTAQRGAGAASSVLVQLL